jgi:putative FmdB family regulatory protein
MPMFEYRCLACGHHFEKLQKAGAERETVCPACGSAEVKKEISAFQEVPHPHHRPPVSPAAEGCDRRRVRRPWQGYDRGTTKRRTHQ